MTIAKDEAIEFLQLFATEAIRAAKNSGTKTRTLEYFKELWRQRDKVAEREDLPPSSTRKLPMGVFSATRRALWLNRAALGAWMGPTGRRTDADQMIEFYDGNYIERHLRGFIARKGQETWWATKSAQWQTIPEGSIAMHGIAGATLWLGIRTPEEIRTAIAALPDVFTDARLSDPHNLTGDLLRMLNGQQRAVLLQQPVTSRAVGSPPSSYRTVRWEERLGALHEVLDTHAISVIQTVAGLTMINVPTTYAVLREVSSISINDFDALITRLENEEWLSIEMSPATGGKLDDRLVVLNAAAEGALRESFRHSYPDGAILYGILSGADEARSLSPALRARLLTHPLVVTLYERFEPTPARRLRLLIGVLPPQDAERAEAAVNLAPYDPECALDAINEYLRAYPDADEVLPRCLLACVSARKQQAFEMIWPTVAVHACTHSGEMTRRLVAEERQPAWPFADVFLDTMFNAVALYGHDGLVRLCRESFDGDNQCWTLWFATLLLMARETIASAIDSMQLSRDLRRYYEALLMR